MRALNIPFTEKLHAFGPSTGAPQFENTTPSGLVPCLLDGDIVSWDSLGITEYLAERFPHVWPDDAVARNWARCATAEMHSGFSNLRNICPMNCSVEVSLHSIPEGLTKDIKRLDSLWQEGLSKFKGPYLAGAKFSAVDAFFAPVAFRIKSYGLILSEGSMGYVERLLDLPDMQAWKASAIEEPWVDAEHEHECYLHGTLLSDLRQHKNS